MWQTRQFFFVFDGKQGETCSQSFICPGHLQAHSWALLIDPNDTAALIQFFVNGKPQLLENPFTGDATTTPWTPAQLEKRGRHLFGPIEYFSCRPGDEIRVDVQFDADFRLSLVLGGRYHEPVQ